jgi:hypothetical protein
MKLERQEVETNFAWVFQQVVLKCLESFWRRCSTIIDQRYDYIP